MNKRIRELAEQAITERLSIDEYIEALKKEPNDFYGFRVGELQKFAELLIKECAGVAFEYAPTDESACEVSSAIEQHFEVK
jgi:hypothetical protein